MSNRHLKCSMSNAELNTSSAPQNSASPTNFIITVDASSILPEVQTNNSSKASSFTLSNNQSSCDILKGTIWSGLFYPTSSSSALAYWLHSYKTDFIGITFYHSTFLTSFKLLTHMSFFFSVRLSCFDHTICNWATSSATFPIPLILHQFLLCYRIYFFLTYHRTHLFIALNFYFCLFQLEHKFYKDFCLFYSQTPIRVLET